MIPITSPFPHPGYSGQREAVFPKGVCSAGFWLGILFAAVLHPSPPPLCLPMATPFHNAKVGTALAQAQRCLGETSGHMGQWQVLCFHVRLAVGSGGTSGFMDTSSVL